MHGGDRIAEVLRAHGVKFLFTLCGGHISPILVGARQRNIRVIDVRHEATAVFAADAVARLSGVPGVAAVTAGPGATNTITAVKNAQMAQSPVVILGGAAATMLKGRGALQDIDQLALYRPQVKWAVSVKKVRDLAPTVSKALQVAAEGVPGPVFVECPVDLLYEEATVKEWYAASARGKSLASRATGLYLRRHVKSLFAGTRTPFELPAIAAPVATAPAEAILDKVCERLGKAERPVLVVGSQALLEPDAVARLADALERIGMPVYLSGMARGLLGPAHDLHLRHKRRLALKEADTVILAGVPCDFRLDYGRSIARKAFLIAANRSKTDLGLNRRPNLAVPADPGSFLRLLAERCTGSNERWQGWLDSLRQRDNVREDEISAQGDQPAASHINPVKLCQRIDAALPDNSVLVADGGDFVGTASYVVRPRAPLCWLDPGAFGTLGVGAGFALGAALCRPESEVWVLFGDGSVGYSLAEFDTFVRHGIPVLAVVGNDACWSQIAREQIKILGDDVGTVLARTDYHRVVAGFGAAGLPLCAPEEIDEVIAAARRELAAGKPVLVNAWLGTTDFREGSLSM